ncbi:MAG TPA: FKBP-type peptidyl-prolyl cis-trans isomerase [Solirubrobacterales bacterium]|nr:FKBP-type peptidyl-prolyl cis-trans isomerase [Solirubrobacterales bacterium]
MRTSLAILATLLTVLACGCGGGDEAATGYGARDTTTEATSAKTVPDAARPVPDAEPEEPVVRPPKVSDPDDPRFATVSDGAGRKGQPAIVPSDRPPPKRLLVRDIEVGSGPVARPGDRVGVFYLGVDYKTGERRFQTWPPTAQPFEVELRAPDSAEAWELGVMGMRAGGRREVLVPSHLAFDDGALDYLFDLVRVEPAGSG